MNHSSAPFWLAVLSFISLTALLNVYPAQAQEPGLADSLVIGNRDGSLIIASPNETIRIPIWVKTDDSVAFAFIPVILSQNYFSAFNGGQSFFPLPCTSRFRGPGIGDPLWAISVSFFAYIGDETCMLITDYQWEHMADIIMTTSADTMIYGDTTSISPYYDPNNGGLLFGLNDGLTGLIPITRYGRIYFSPIVPGDANGSGDVNGLDAVYLVNYLKGIGPVPNPILRGDSNGNCVLNGLDVIYLVNYLKGIGPAPVAGDCR